MAKPELFVPRTIGSAALVLIGRAYTRTAFLKQRMVYSKAIPILFTKSCNVCPKSSPAQELTTCCAGPYDLGASDLHYRLESGKCAR
jgi:hypothetical protein